MCKIVDCSLVAHRHNGFFSFFKKNGELRFGQSTSAPKKQTFYRINDEDDEDARNKQKVRLQNAAMILKSRSLFESQCSQVEGEKPSKKNPASSNFLRKRGDLDTRP